LGGFTHSFGKKGKWRWDVGLHYVGDMHPKSKVRKVFDFVTNKKLEWQSFPNPFQYYIYPDFKFAVPASAQQFQAEIIKMFPEAEPALVQYFKDLKKVSGAWLLLQLNDKSLIKKIIFIFSAKTKLLLKLTTKDYLDLNFKDQKLKALLDSQWGDTGLPSAKSPFHVHALLVSHYLRGAYYPKAGSHKIAETIMEVVKMHGGEAQSFAHVTEVLFEKTKNKVQGCRYTEKKNTPEGIIESSKEVYAPLVISNAGARITYAKWVPPTVNSDMKQKIASVPPGLSSLTVYIGLKENPKKLGIQGENYWIFSDYDHDKMAANCNQVIIGKPSLAFVSFGSAHNTEIQNSTAQIITFIEPKAFEKWQSTQFQKRGEEYQELKNNMANSLIAFVDKHISGFKDLVEFIEVGTPLTVTHYTDQPFGEIYGLSGTAERYTLLKDLGAETPVENLYLTGADVSMAGVAGALFGGVITFYKIAVRELFSLQSSFATFKNLLGR
jgi:phytoene dehydrogenase-like protein